MTKKETIKKTLTAQQEFFCKLYATDREFFGNGTQSYIEAYDLDEKNTASYQGARSSAHRLLTNVNILDRINELLELGPLSEANLDKQLAFCITQSAELGVKVRAISEANKLKGRITEKRELSVDKDKPLVMTVELADRIEQVMGKPEVTD